MKTTIFLILHVFLINTTISQWTFETNLPYDSNQSPVIMQICVIDSSYSFALGSVLYNQNNRFPYFAKRNMYGWQQIYPDLNQSIKGFCFTAVDSSNLWLGTYHPDEIYHSSNGGFNWELQIHVADTGHVQGIMFCKNNPEIGYSYASLALNTFWNGVSILKTTNRGLNWQKWDFVYYGYLGGENCIAVTDCNHAWIGVANVLDDNKKIIMTTNGGENWIVTDVNVGLGGPYTIQFSTNNQTGIFSGQINPTNWFFRTTDSGFNWTIVYTTTYYFSETMRWIPGTSNIYGNSEFIVVHSIDNGLTWTTMNGYGQNLQSLDAVRINEGTIYALLVTTDRKVYKLLDTNVVIGIENIGSNVPKFFNLYQNYPNPFNPSTTITFDLPKDANVTIEIYDIIGKVVATLSKDEFKKAGSYKAIWNASNYASGVYFYRIEVLQGGSSAGNFVQSKKMVLLK